MDWDNPYTYQDWLDDQEMIKKRQERWDEEWLKDHYSYKDWLDDQEMIKKRQERWDEEWLSNLPDANIK